MFSLKEIPDTLDRQRSIQIFESIIIPMSALLHLTLYKIKLNF